MLTFNNAKKESVDCKFYFLIVVDLWLRVVALLPRTFLSQIELSCVGIFVTIGLSVVKSHALKIT